jgi:NAD+ synthetase
MPCHSSSSAYDRAKLLADELKLELLKVDLSFAHNGITEQLSGQAQYDWTSNGTAGGFRSCLRAPTLSFVAHATNGIIVGTGNRSEDHITRYFQKFGDGCVDFCPIADLWKSEIRSLFKFLAEEATGAMGPGSQATYDAKPSADLWGAEGGQEDEKELGATYDEVEWADREDMSTEENVEGPYEGQNITLPGIVFYDRPPTMHPKWAGYTERQQFVINLMWSMEKSSRHKFNPNLPVCTLRDRKDLVE